VSYTFKDIINSLRKVGIKNGDVVYLSGDLSLLGNFINKKKILKSFHNAIISVIGKNGTICFPTHTFSIIPNKKLFDLKTTPSETGVLTEYLRKIKGSVRQYHPYSSTTCLGKYANLICKNNTKNVYGPKSPFARMIKLNTKIVNFGLEPRFCSSSVHHSEYMSNVPYRYNKVFFQEVKIGKKTKSDKFYMYVINENLKNIKRDKNIKIFNHFLKRNKIQKTKLGRGYLYSYDLKKFYLDNLIFLKKDIYGWLRVKPKKK
tara:strand:+ start:1252 stop:2031 length:780 start_codon:yes stop_codon:yes gene_type:complete